MKTGGYGLTSRLRRSEVIFCLLAIVLVVGGCAPRHSPHVQALDTRINDLLLEQEAKRLGTTPKALIDLHVRTRVHIVSEEQARAYYEEQKAVFKGKFSEHKFQIMQFLQGQESEKSLAVYAEELRKGAAVQVYLIPPTQPNLRQLCCNPVD